VTTPALTTESVVRLYPLHIGEEVDEAVEVGRPDTGVFVSLPVEGATVVRWLVDRVPLMDVAERFSERFGVELDVLEFIRDLSECGFIRSVDDRELVEANSDDAQVAPRGLRLFAQLPQSRVAWLLSKPAYLAYATIWVTTITLLATRPDLRPSASRAYLDIGVLGNLVMLTCLSWLLLLFHELAHLVATRARGCNGTLDISYRLYFFVAQTDISSVRTLPRDQRYAPYLAGMTWDATVVMCCMLLQLAGAPPGVPSAICYLLVMTMLFELALFMRTDVYYVMTNMLRLGNLMGDTRRWLANLASRCIGSAPRHDLSDIPIRELRIVRWYAGVVVIGVGVLIAQLVFLGLPLLAKFLQGAASGLREGPASLSFWDGMALYAVAAAQFGLLFVAVMRERRRVAARSAAAAAGRALVDS
jgi:hypothetical protein